jgi:hypothetical protein
MPFSKGIMACRFAFFKGIRKLLSTEANTRRRVWVILKEFPKQYMNSYARVSAGSNIGEWDWLGKKNMKVLCGYVRNLGGKENV